MTKKRKPKPEVSDDIRARRAERRELISRGLEVNIDPRTEEILGIRQPDCFRLLLRDSNGVMHDLQNAVDWLEMLIRTASGENTRERRPDFIRSSCEGAPGQNVSNDMIEASERLQVVQEALPPSDARMLFDLLKPDAALITRWRDVVARCTRETNPSAQGARVRAACGHLAWVKQSIDRLQRERKERRVAA